MYCLCFHVPFTHLEAVKEAIFQAGAGKIGNYAHCSWQTAGEGQFMPQFGSDPYIGQINILEKVKEYKVETICEEELIHKVLKALKQAHPYETPSYQVFKMEVF